MVAPSGAALVELRVLVLNGDPVQWFEPKITRLEPKRTASQFLEVFVSETRAEVESEGDTERSD